MAETASISTEEYFQEVRNLNRRIAVLSQQMRNPNIMPSEVGSLEIDLFSHRKQIEKVPRM